MIQTYYIANLLDAALTVYAVQQGLAHEANTVMRLLLGSPLLFLAVKTIVPLGVAAWLRNAPTWFQGLCAGLMTIVCLWNVYVLGLA